MACRRCNTGPSYANAYNNKGAAYSFLDQFERAIETYNEAIRLNPQSAEAYYNRGLAFYRLGPSAHEPAREDYQEAVRLDPQYAGDYYEEGPLLRGTVIPPTSQ